MNMKYTLLAVFFSGTLALAAQTTRDYAVMITATVSESPASITLNWQADTAAAATGYQVYRKEKQATDWGTPVATLSKNSTQYTDANVTAGKGYEYYVRRTYTSSTRFAHGYVYAGAAMKEPAARGKLLLLVDENYAQPLSAEIAQLQSDLVADGWYVKKKNILRSMAVTSVKTIIRNEYDMPGDTGTKRLTAVYLLGRIPVPYSGDIFPDGHRPDHRGAWPADVYYGVLDENAWTDQTVHSDTATDARNHNVPGDGRFDQNYVYTQGNDVALQIGRVDLTNMPQFGLSDTLLVQRYLQKVHRFKTGQTPVVRRGLIDDNFGVLGGEAFASTAWTDFSVMFGDSVFERDYFPSVKQGNYLFSYGCGEGNYFSAHNVGKTIDFNNDSVNVAFTCLFGSYFGDWDNANNFLRAPLCAPSSGLACAWSGRPYWHFHHMALGGTLGYAAQLAQSNYSDFTAGNHFGYAFDVFPTFVHIALMGDPSLRLHPFAPATGFTLNAISNGQQVTMHWNKAATAAGYELYHAHSADEPFTLLTTLTANDSSFTDAAPFNGRNVYMLRVLKKENTPSGTYINRSLGVLDSVTAVNTGMNEQTGETSAIGIYPNPTSGNVTVYANSTTAPAMTIDCYDVTGKLLQHTDAGRSFSTELDLSGYQGLVLLRVQCGDQSILRKVLVQ